MDRLDAVRAVDSMRERIQEDAESEAIDRVAQDLRMDPSELEQWLRDAQTRGEV